MTSSTIAVLESALDQAGKIITAIRPEQEALPTPCRDWDVRALVQHLVAQDLRNFTAAAHGEQVDYQAPPDELPDDWSAAFKERSAQLVEAWRAAGLDEMDDESPQRSGAAMQIAEFAVHGWDLVRATGAPIELDDRIAEYALTWSRPMLRPEFRGPDMPFGDEVQVPEDASIQDRMAAWFGRDPSWTPAR